MQFSPSQQRLISEWVHSRQQQTFHPHGQQPHMQQAKWMQLAAQQLQSELQRAGMRGTSWKATPAGHWSHQPQQEALTGGAWDGHQRSHGEQHWAGDGVWDGHQQARREQQRADFELSNMHSQVRCLSH